MFHLKSVFLDEYFEPALGRAIRSTLAFILPLLWGLTIGNMGAAVWIAIGAQLLSTVNVSGSYPMKLLVMSGAIIASGIAGMLGILVGGSWILSTLLMLILAFFGGFVRQSGSHGPGIMLSVLLIYLLSLNLSGGFAAAGKMFIWVLSGGLIALIFTLLYWVFIPFSPFRRSVSYAWKAMSDWVSLLAETISKGQEDGNPVNELDEKEFAFREELSNSMELLSRHQGIRHGHRNRLSYQLVELRRIVSFSDPALTSLIDALGQVKTNPEFPEKLLFYILENLSQAMRRIAISIISNRPEDVYATGLIIRRIKNNIELLEKDLPKSISKIAGEQTVRSLNELTDYLEEAMGFLQWMSHKSGSMTFFIRNFFTGMTIPQKLPVVRFTFSPKSFTFRFSLRLALAMAIGVAVYKIFNVSKGYWIAMTAMIILQPELGATFTKALDRLKGTLSGAIIGSLIFLFPLPLSIKMAVVLFSAFVMMYYIQHNYALAAFFITIMVIALYHLLEPVTWQIALIRVLNTLGGAGLALLGGYAFFPLWERYRFPALMAKAIAANKDYFSSLLTTVSSGIHWTNMNFIKPRREAEITNSNAFQSLRRMKSEPQKMQTNRQLYFLLIGYNIRLTRLIKTLNQQLIKYPGLVGFGNLQSFKRMIEEMLEGAGKKAEQEFSFEPEKQLHPDEIIRQINLLLKELPDAGSDQKLIKGLLERITKETVGLYYAIDQIKAPPVKLRAGFAR